MNTQRTMENPALQKVRILRAHIEKYPSDNCAIAALARLLASLRICGVTADQLLTIPGLYEVVSKHFNAEMVQDFIAEYDCNKFDAFERGS